MKKTPKLIVTNKTAIRRGRKYGNGARSVDAALKRMIAADQRRGTVSVRVDLDALETGLKNPDIASTTCQRLTKNAIDKACSKCAPAYLMIVGAIDIVPTQELANPLNSDRDPTNDDEDTVVPIDLPYACEEGYSTNPTTLLGPVLERGDPASPPHEERQPLGVERIVGQPLQPLALPRPHNSGTRRGVLPRPGRCADRRTAGPAPTGVAGRRNRGAAVHTRHRPFFFAAAPAPRSAPSDRRTRRTVASGRSPANRYASCSRRCLPIAKSCQVLRSARNVQTLVPCGFPAPTPSLSTHSIPRRPSF